MSRPWAEWVADYGPQNDEARPEWEGIDTGAAPGWLCSNCHPPAKVTQAIDFGATGDDARRTA